MAVAYEFNHFFRRVYLCTIHNSYPLPISKFHSDNIAQNYPPPGHNGPHLSFVTELIATAPPTNYADAYYMDQQITYTTTSLPCFLLKWILWVYRLSTVSLYIPNVSPHPSREAFVRIIVLCKWFEAQNLTFK